MGRAAHLMTHAVTLAPAASNNNYGDTTYGTQVTIAARVEHKRSLVTNASGNQVAAEHRITSEDEIEFSDRVWLPGDDTAKAAEARKAIAVSKIDSPLDTYTLYRAWF